jgi:hypothetical protein
VLFHWSAGSSAKQQITNDFAKSCGHSEFPNVTVLRMAMPGAKWFEGSWVDAERRRLVKEVLIGTRVTTLCMVL